jgi:single-stranded-DNA-specific exonuclease
MKAVAWNMGHRAEELTDGTICSVVFQPGINEWNGRREVQLEVKDIQIHQGDEHAEAG